MPRAAWRPAGWVACVLAGVASGCAVPGPRGSAAMGAISVDARCEQTEEDGFRERARLRVVDGEVRSLSWEQWLPRQGACRFDLDAFRQIRTGDVIELTERSGAGCRLLVWQAPARVTLAHTGCERRCEAGTVYEEAWPVMFDPATGGCATR